MTDYRLLVLSCSATKNPGKAPLPPRRRYTGPLWKVLNRADPHGKRAALLTLSARYGMISEWSDVAHYDEQMTPATARRMIAGGIRAHWPPMTADRWTPAAITSLEIAHDSRKRPFDDICLVGGELYIDVMRAFIAEAQRTMPRKYSPDARITVINAPIGVMLQDMRGWLLKDLQREMFI